MKTLTVGIAALVLATAGHVLAQSSPAPAATAAKAGAGAAAPAATVSTPSDYVIGAGDVLTITYRYEKDMNGEYLVRPDGMITLPLINDISAKGLNPDQLRERLTKASLQFIKDPTITVGVKAINSRKVSILGGVQKTGQYDILGPMTVLDLISLAGGLKEFVDGKEMSILRGDVRYKFNYKDVLKGTNTKQNIPLMPGDVVMVPE